MIYPRWEGNTKEISKKKTLLDMVEVVGTQYGFATRFLGRIEVEFGEDPYIVVGHSGEIYPYYANLKYNLNPYDETSSYYLISIGFNWVDGEDFNLNRIVSSLGERINYGIGAGKEFENSKIEVLYGRYNYKMIMSAKLDEKNLYSSTRITILYEYKFR
jgi:hypothetical protein